MVKHISHTAICLSLLLVVGEFLGQDCEPGVPVFDVDLTSDANMTWYSPFVVRNDHCCGASGPEQCVAFIITLNPEAEGIIFDICDGAISSGAMYYQVDCSPPVAVGSALCLSGVGPHYLTFCKPGNNSNVYCITSVAEPGISPDMTVAFGCNANISVWGYDPSTIYWNSISPGIPGQYNNLLNCTSCATVNVANNVNSITIVEFQVCGMPLGGCDLNESCLSIAVTLYPILSVGVFPEEPIVCYGAATTSVTAFGTGGLGPYSYLWSNGQTGATANLSAGNSWVEISDQAGCGTQIFYFPVQQVTTAPAAVAGADQIICNGATSFDLFGSVAGASAGLWSGGNGSWAYSPDILNNIYYPSPYELLNGVSLLLSTVDNYGCPVASDIIALQPGLLQGNFTVSEDHVSCAGLTDGSIAIAFTSATSELTFDWSIPGISTQLTSVSDLPAGTYSVYISDTWGCDTTVTATILEPPVLNLAQLVQEDATCFGEANGSLFVQPSGGVSPYTITLNNSDMNLEGMFMTEIPSGNYTLSVTDANGCYIDQPIFISQPDALYATISGDVSICPGETATLEIQTTGGTGLISYNWNMGLGNAPTHSVNPTSTTTYSVTVMDENNCSIGPFTTTVNVAVITTTGLNMEATEGVCYGDVAEVEAVFNGNYGPYTYQWNENLGTQQGTFYTYPEEPTWYVFTVYDICGNSLTDSVFVDVYQVPEIDLPGNLGQGCAPFNISLGANIPDEPGMTWNWSFGDGFYSYAANPVYTYQNPGMYEVSVMCTTAEGCVAYSDGNGIIQVYETPVASIFADPLITPLSQATITFNSLVNGDGISNAWSFGGDIFTIGDQVQYTFTDTGIYYVTLDVMNQYGCASEAGIYIEVLPEYELIIPNVFTPDPDHEPDGHYDATSFNNDVFYPFTEYVRDFEMYVFNRWGELIFESNDIAFGWNGYYRNVLCLQDVYAYRIKVTHTDGRVNSVLGNITLLR